MDSLLVLTECRSALAEAKTLSDVLAIRDKAEAIRQLLKVQGAALETQNQMAELTVVAEIKLGEWVPSATPHGGKRRSRLHDETLKLSDLGISKIQSHRWQTMAAAKKQVAKLCREATESGKDFTRSVVYRTGKAILSGDKPKRSTKDDWSAAQWIIHLRRTVEKIYDECPVDCRACLPHVLREISEELLGREEQDASRGDREEVASVA